LYSKWSVAIQLLQEGIPWEVIEKLEDIEVVVVQAMLAAISEKQAEMQGNR